MFILLVAAVLAQTQLTTFTSQGFIQSCAYTVSSDLLSVTTTLQIPVSALTTGTIIQPFLQWPTNSTTFDVQTCTTTAWSGNPTINKVEATIKDYLTKTAVEVTAMTAGIPTLSNNLVLDSS